MALVEETDNEWNTDQSQELCKAVIVSINVTVNAIH